MRGAYHRYPFRVEPRLCGRDGASGLCLRCGLKGVHLTWADCICDLRDLVAEREIEIVRLRQADPNVRRGPPRKMQMAAS